MSEFDKVQREIVEQMIDAYAECEDPTDDLRLSFLTEQFITAGVEQFKAAQTSSHVGFDDMDDYTTTGETCLN